MKPFLRDIVTYLKLWEPSTMNAINILERIEETLNKQTYKSSKWKGNGFSFCYIIITPV